MVGCAHVCYERRDDRQWIVLGYRSVTKSIPSAGVVVGFPESIIEWSREPKN